MTSAQTSPEKAFSVGEASSEFADVSAHPRMKSSSVG